MSILGSVLLYIPGNLRYIDALFFAAGASTQSGLNPVDINLLKTYQQVVIFLFSLPTNPIAINTFVVFLRLYWFEKRFQHIAKEAKRQRSTISKSRSQMKGERDVREEEQGVNGRKITVMHGGNGAAARGHRKANGKAKHGMDHTLSGGPDDFAITFDKDETLDNNLSRTFSPPPLKAQATIKFADQVKRSDGADDDHLRMPERRDTEAHIAFLERQRNRNDGILRIPGPRDMDRGLAPETIEDDVPSSPTSRRRGSMAEPFPQVDDGANEERDHLSPLAQYGREQTIEEQPSVGRIGNIEESAHAAFNALNVINFRRPRVPKDGEQEQGDDAGLEKKRSRVMSFSTLKRHFTRDKEVEDPMPYISFQPTIGRNSAFVDLTEAQREELGGIEYRSLKALAAILVTYFWFWSFFGYVCLAPWIVNSGFYGAIVDAAGQNRVWWGFFTGSSAFNDVGFTLTPDSMSSFQTAVFPLLLLSFLILIGNTAFPVMLRWTIWLGSHLVPRHSAIWEELKFLLDHPRRCFTLLFPSSATWWLFGVLVLLNGIDLLFFVILDFGNEVVTGLPPNIRVLDGWFQAVSTRTVGFAVVNLAELHPGIQISYLVMMYISIFPIAISVRRTNVYEEQSLGIWGGDENEDAETSYVGSHIRRQLSFDLWFVALGWFIVAIAEGSRIQNPDEPAFNLFALLFEIISAYGTVGLSLGYPGSNASFSAQFGVIAKLIIIAMQIRGRHRGLPYELDRAILLPSESLRQRAVEAADARRRRASFVANADGGPLNNVKTNGTNLEKDTGVSSSFQAPKTRQRSSSNFLSSILHPGPSMPPPHKIADKITAGVHQMRHHQLNSTYDEGEHHGPATEDGNLGGSVKRSTTHNPTVERSGSFYGPPKKRMSV